MPQPSADWLLDFYEHAPCGFHSLDPDGIFLSINNTELTWLGYARAEVVGRKNFSDILTIEGRHTFEQNFSKLKSGGVLRDVEFDFVRKDGTTLPVLVSATAARDAAGKFAMSRAVVYDLSSRKHSENRFRTILEAAPDAILICNREGLITLAGGQTERILDYRSGELMGLSLESLLPAKSRIVHEQCLKNFFEGPQVRPMGLGRHLTALRRDGKEIPVEVSLSPLQCDGINSVLAIVRDVSDKQEIQRTEILFRSVFSAMAEGMVVQEQSGEISACNQSAERILGLTADQMKGHTSIDPMWGAIREDGSPFPGEMHPAMITLRSGKPQSNVCMGLRKPDGTTTWILINSEPIFHPSTRQPHSVVTTFSDITERKRLEEQLLQSRKLEAVGQLAGGVAHDFNNVLGVIIGHCDLMREQFADDEKAKAHTSAIKKSAEHAAALTRQLLAFSRKQAMQMRPVDLNEVIRGAGEMLNRVIREDIELTMRLAPNLGLVNADPVQVEQVLMNLGANARDAMSKGGKLTIETANAELDTAYAASHPGVKAGRYVSLSVSDTGSGMDELTLSKVFEPFYTTKEMGRGTGLGLSIIYGIVRQIGGHITVYSEAGVGSTFQIYFPRLDNAAYEASVPVQITRNEPRSETILLVEDDPDLLEILKAMLIPCGYNLLTASTAKETVTTCKNYRGEIDLMISDMVLKGGSGGLELVRKIRAKRPKIKVLLISGYSESFVAKKAVVGNFLQKPFSAEQLRQRILEVLGTR